MKVLVAGFGNELIPGDDCGLRVVEALRGCGRDVDVKWLGRGVQTLIHLLPRYDLAVLVDASRRVEPGRVRVEKLECGALREELQSLHEAGLVEAACLALEAAEALGRRPIVYLVECGVGDGAAPIREAVEAVEGLLVAAKGGPGDGQEARGDG